MSRLFIKHLDVIMDLLCPRLLFKLGYIGHLFRNTVLNCSLWMNTKFVNSHFKPFCDSCFPCDQTTQQTNKKKKKNNPITLHLWRCVYVLRTDWNVFKTHQLVIAITTLTVSFKTSQGEIDGSVTNLLPACEP